MGKVVKPILTVGIAVVAVALAAPTGGLSVASALGLSGLAGTVVGGLAAAAFTLGATALSNEFGLGPKRAAVNRASQDRLFASIDPDASRKMVFGRTAMATDVRYQSYTGTDQEYYHQIICVASHKVEAIEEFWEDNELVWTSTGGVQSNRSGYLTVAVVLEGAAGNAINIDSTWNATNGCRLTGCAYLHVTRKTTGNSKKSESPYASGVPSRITIRGKGFPTYDARKDSTVGGSGTQRYDDQTTRAWEVSGNAAARNAAIGLLNYLIGWKINGKLAVGRGVPANRIDLASFIDGANLCDELVALAAGGTEKRYRYDNVHGEDEDGDSVIAAFLNAMNATLDDDGGKLRLRVAHNDLADPQLVLMTEDIVGPFEWNEFIPLDQRRNVVRGRYTDASNAGLYQLAESPPVVIASVDGIERVMPFEAPGVQSPTQHQRLMKQALQRLQYPGSVALLVNAKGYAARRGMVVDLTFYPIGAVNSLWRVAERSIPFDGKVALLLRREHDDLYAWDAEESAPVVAASPSPFDPLNDPLIAGIGDAGTTAEWSEVIDDDGNKPEDKADVTLLVSPATLVVEIPFNANGTPKTDELPVDVAFKLLRGASADVTASATWSIALTSGSADVSIDSATGIVTIDDADTDAEAIVNALYGGIARKGTLQIKRQVDAAPTGGGGGGGGTVSSTGAISTTNSTSYGAANTPTLTQTAPAGGTINLTAPLSFRRSGAGTSSAAGKWQWRAIGGSWADVAAETASTVAAETEELVPGEPGLQKSPGSVSVSAAKTGLTSGTAYEFQLLLRAVSPSPAFSGDRLTFSGTASATPA